MLLVTSRTGCSTIRLISSTMQKSLFFPRLSMMSTNNASFSTSNNNEAEKASSSQSAENASTSDNQEDIKRVRKKLVVFGGNGYVGQAMVKQALKSGLDVVSINRSGSPRDFIAPRDASGTIDWVRGDIFTPSDWREVLHGAEGVISCVGAFGSNEFMEKINGDANIIAVEEALKAHVPRFVYVSTVENNLPDFVLKGYFIGKRKAERALQEKYNENGIILRPGFIHGTRTVPVPAAGDIHLPLWVLGKPMETIFSTAPVKFVRDHVPGLKAILASPVSVENLAKVGVAAAIGDVSNRVGGVFTIDDIQTVARQL